MLQHALRHLVRTSGGQYQNLTGRARRAEWAEQWRRPGGGGPGNVTGQPNHWDAACNDWTLWIANL